MINNYFQVHSNLCSVGGNEIAESCPIKHTVLLHESILQPLPCVLVWSWSATKGHAVTLLPLPSLGWGGEWKENGKTHG